MKTEVLAPKAKHGEGKDSMISRYVIKVMRDIKRVVFTFVFTDQRLNLTILLANNNLNYNHTNLWTCKCGFKCIRYTM